jgi:hypothetical protein
MRFQALDPVALTRRDARAKLLQVHPAGRAHLFSVA